MAGNCDMNDFELIKKSIKKISRGKIFSRKSISDKYPVKVVRRVLFQLAKANEIGTLSHGMYYKPSKSRYLPGHSIPPGTEDIIRAVSKITGEVISVHAARALNLVGLSTQVPARAIYFTT
jgi:hypothetical protein